MGNKIIDCCKIIIKKHLERAQFVIISKFFLCGLHGLHILFSVLLVLWSSLGIQHSFFSTSWNLSNFPIQFRSESQKNVRVMGFCTHIQCVPLGYMPFPVIFTNIKMCNKTGSSMSQRCFLFRISQWQKLNQLTCWLRKTLNVI